MRRRNLIGSCACLDAGLSCGGQLITEPPASASGLAPPLQDDGKTKTIAIASGAAAGGVLCLTALAGFVVFLRWRKRKQGDQPSSSDDSATHMPTRSSAISEYSNIAGQAPSDSKGQSVVVSAPYDKVSDGGTYGSTSGGSDSGYAALQISPPQGYGAIPVAHQFSGAYDVVQPKSDSAVTVPGSPAYDVAPM
jgi:hypothetical protein